MAFYRTCPKCGGNLDPGEKCDCEERAEQERDEIERFLVQEKSSGQMAFVLNRERRKV